MDRRRTKTEKMAFQGTWKEESVLGITGLQRPDEPACAPAREAAPVGSPVESSAGHRWSQQDHDLPVGLTRNDVGISLHVSILTRIKLWRRGPTLRVSKQEMKERGRKRELPPHGARLGLQIWPCTPSGMDLQEAGDVSHAQK